MESLSQTLESFDIPIDPDIVTRLDRYRDQLWTWNERLNLTRHTTLEKFVTRDILDSWKLAELIPSGERVLDVGTGGGVPGLVLALLRPDLRIQLCESVAKKARAVQAIVTALDIDVPVHPARAEDVLEIRTFDTLVARAVASLDKMLRWFQPYWESFDQILVVKGKAWIQERATARQQGLLAGLQLRRASVYNVPGTPIESVILRIWPNADRSR